MPENKIPDIVIDAAKSMMNGRLMTSYSRTNINDLRIDALNSIKRYKDYKNSIEEEERISKEISDWLDQIGQSK